MKKIIYTKNAPEPIGPYNQAVMVDNTLFVSGQIGISPLTNSIEAKNLREQAEQTMKNIEAILKEAGMNLSNVVKTTIYLTDMNNFSIINEVYGSFFTSDFPARETVQVCKLPKSVDVEISVIALKG